MNGQEIAQDAYAAFGALASVSYGARPLVFMLSKYEQLHIYPIQPRASAQFRTALVPSGAKDDPSSPWCK